MGRSGPGDTSVRAGRLGRGGRLARATAVVAGVLVVLAIAASGGQFLSARGDAGGAPTDGTPAVTQPIEFPHFRHAGPASQDGMEINCLYCHTYARRSKVAGIPPVAKCMGCHEHIATDKERIQELTEYWRQGKTIPWKKVHDLPDFVYFSHERHVQRFVFQQGQPVQKVCGYCHGDVKTMTVAEKRKPLTMGWCLSCHKQFQEDPAGTPKPASEWVIANADEPLAPPEDATHAAAKAPRDCWQCHK